MKKQTYKEQLEEVEKLIQREKVLNQRGSEALIEKLMAKRNQLKKPTIAWITDSQGNRKRIKRPDYMETEFGKKTTTKKKKIVGFSNEYLYFDR